MSARSGASFAERTLQASGGIAEHAPARRPARADRDEAAYERWLAHVTERLDPTMAFLGIVFALLAAFDLASPDLSPGWRRALDATTWTIWAVFLLDYAARLIAAPSAVSFVRRHWLAVVMLVIPTLRVLRLGALMRLSRGLPAARVVSTSYRASGGARRLARSRIGYLAALAVVMVLAVAQLAWLLESDRGTFDTFGDALLWAASVVIAMQGDPVPVTGVGRLVMVTGFGVGLVLVASLAGTVGAFLLEDRRERDAS